MELQYKIIGGDGGEYGPASLDELKAWIADGRVAGFTKIWRNDRDSWAPASVYAELAEDFVRQESALKQARNSALVTAGFWPRFGAYWIDYFLMALVSMGIWLFLADRLHWTMYPFFLPETAAEMPKFMDQFRSAEYHVFEMRILLVFLPVSFIYQVFMTGKWGATLGKMVLGMRIVTVEGADIRWWTAIMRWGGTQVSQYILYIGYLLVALHPEKRALHDLLAGTKVVFKP